MGESSEKRTRNPERTRAQILAVAFKEVFRHGFQGVSVNEIIAKTDLTKGAFFHHFETKQALGYALADETLKEMVLERWIRPLDHYENPLVGIPEVLKKVIDSTPEESIPLGCPLNNLVQEMSSVDPVFRDKLRAVLELWIEGVERHLRRAKKSGYLKKEVDPRRLAEFIVMNHEGAFGMTKSLRDRQVFRSLHASLKSYLETLMTEPA
jgi:AcrR family transcriptional regulator